MHRVNVLAWAGVLISAVLMLSCREQARRETASGGASPAPGIRQIELQPGARLPDRHIKNPYEGDARALAEGKRLYGWYNCAGCHFNGGGGIGPPLMDDKWIYGSNPENIRSVIVEGRPNGMPSYGGKIPSYQLWQIVAYVRSLSGIAGGESGPRSGQISMADAPEENMDQQTTRQSQEPARE